MASSDAQHIGAWTFTSRGAPSEILKYSATHPAPPWPPSPAYFKAAGKGKPARAAEQEQWLLVRTSHAALNPGDRFTLRMLPRFMRAATQVPGTDLAGDVVDVWGSSEGAPGDAPAADGEPAQSAAVRRSRRPFRAGDRIIAFLPISFTYATGQGSLQTLVVIPARFAALNPAATASVLASPGGAQPSEDAIGAFAGLPLAGSVALALLDSARSGGSGGLGPGDRVLVNAAAGGIGTLTVQMVRRAVGRDGFVVGICSAASRDVVESLGVCDEVVTYDAPPRGHSTVTSYLAARFPTKQPSTPTGSDGQAQDPFDFIIDCHGSQDLYVHSARYLHKGKPYISVGSANRSWTLTALFTTVLRTLVNSLWPLSPWLGGTGREWRTLLVMDPGIDVLERLAAMARGERDVIGEAEEAAERARPLRVIVDSVFGFEEVLAAYERLERGHMKGKIIIRVGQAE